MNIIVINYSALDDILLINLVFPFILFSLLFQLFLLLNIADIGLVLLFDQL